MALPIPQQWKNLSAQQNDDAGFDLGTLQIIEDPSLGIIVKQAPSATEPWGDQCTLTWISTKPQRRLKVTGKHYRTGRDFEIICDEDPGTLKWRQNGKLIRANTGPEGTWMADEGP